MKTSEGGSSARGVAGPAAAATLSARSGSSGSAAARKSAKRTYADMHLVAKVDGVPVSLLPKRRRHVSHDLRTRPLHARIFDRELGISDGLTVRSASARDRFRNIRLQTSFDACDHDTMLRRGMTEARAWLWTRPRSRIIEITSSRDLIFALTQSGVCAAFSRDTNAPICYLNSTQDEFIRSLFLNKTNDSLITVSVFHADNFTALHCRSTPLAHIRKGKLDSSMRIFESESLRWPGFVEFDDVNGKVLTFSAEERNYKVWDLETYEYKYTINDESIFEVKISPGIMLLIHHRSDLSSHIPLCIVDIETGARIKQFVHLLHRHKKIDLIELFDEKLLVKQELENLQIIDIRSGAIITVARSHFPTPTAFIFLYEKRMFLTFRQRQVSVWSFTGELITTFEDHLLWHGESHTNSISIPQCQDLILSFCHSDLEANCGHGTINVSCISSGKRLAKVSCPRCSGPIPGVDLGDGHAERGALSEVTALFYNEERNEIYSGNRDGHVHVWSS